MIFGILLNLKLKIKKIEYINTINIINVILIFILKHNLAKRMYDNILKQIKKTVTKIFFNFLNNILDKSNKVIR